MFTKAAVAVLSLVLLTGCGGSAEPDKLAPPPKVYTAAQLEAALPQPGDVPSGKKVGITCPGAEFCAKPPEDGRLWSRQIELELPFTGKELEEAASSGIADLVDVTVIQNASPVAASTALTAERKKKSAYDGPFDEKAVKTENGFNFGLKGEGTLADATVSGWSGYFVQRDIKLTNLDGGDEGGLRDNELSVVRGAVTVQVRVLSDQGKRTSAECEKIARAVAEGYIKRLG